MKKYTLIAILTLVISSCGYNIKSDREIQLYENMVESAQSDMSQMEEDIAFLRLEFKQKHKLDSIKSAIYKDSIAFMKLKRLACYDNIPHRHSCEIYK